MTISKTDEAPAATRRSRSRARGLRTLRPSAQQYRELIAALAEGVIMISRSGRVIAANPSAMAILGMSPAEIEEALRNDRSWSAVREDGSEFPPAEFPLRKTLRSGSPQKNVVLGVRPGGKALRWLSVNTQPVFGDHSALPVSAVASFEDVTRQRRVEYENAQLAAAVNATPDAITSTDLDYKLVTWNSGAERLYGYAAREALGKTSEWMIPAEKRAEFLAYRERVMAGETVYGWETERKIKSGTAICVESSYAPIRDTRGHITGTVGVHRDVTMMKAMLARIEASEELFRMALNGIPDVFLIYDRDLCLRFVNDRGTEFYARPSSDILGRIDEDLLPAEVVQTYKPVLIRARDTAAPQTAEVSFTLRGRPISMVATFVPMADRDGGLRQILGLLHDFTQRRQTEERLAFMAQYDALTGLPNRYLLLDRLDAAMQRAKRNNTLLGVLFMDIDRFKQINDTRGHTTGDLLLQQVAERLAGALRASDTIARLGGDEFTVLVENASSVEEITAVAEKIKQMFTLPFDTESGEIFTTTSVGITIYPFDDYTRDDLLKNADIAMYHAKQERNSWQLYRPDMNANSANRLSMEVELRHALERGEFELHYQPQINISSGGICGMEALARWTSRTLGSVSPADFVPLAEDTGLIVPLGEWILRAACEQCRAWQAAGLGPLLVSVNISAPQFRRSNLLELVKAVITDYNLAPGWLGLEITESSIMKHPEQTIRTLNDLRELGIAIAIDDFGTGYSSLSYLKRFPVDKIKVDQSFVRDISVDANDAAIVSAVVAMSKQLGLKTIAEGVETAEQLDFLARLACDEYQGHYFSAAVPAPDIERLLRGRR